MSDVTLRERELRAEQLARRELEEQVRHGFAILDIHSMKLDLTLDQIRADIARGDARNEARTQELQRQMNERFDTVDARFEELKELILSLKS